MDIETVKTMSNGYLVNSSAVVPIAEGNRDYQSVQEWIAKGNTPEPEFTDVELLRNTRTVKLNALKLTCKTKIEEGVIHDNAIYPTTLIDQQNLTGLALAATIHGATQEPYLLWCSVGGVWARREHTPEQVTAIATAVFLHVKKCQDDYAMACGLIA